MVQTKEERKEIQRKYYQKNKKRIDAVKEKWRQKNYKKVQDYLHKYYLEHKR